MAGRDIKDWMVLYPGTYGRQRGYYPTGPEPMCGQPSESVSTEMTLPRSNDLKRVDSFSIPPEGASV
jgi:hypothetical protein